MKTWVIQVEAFQKNHFRFLKGWRKNLWDAKRCVIYFALAMVAFPSLFLLVTFNSASGEGKPGARWKPQCFNRKVSREGEELPCSPQARLEFQPWLQRWRHLVSFCSRNSSCRSPIQMNGGVVQRCIHMCVCVYGRTDGHPHSFIAILIPIEGRIQSLHGQRWVFF